MLAGRAQRWNHARTLLVATLAGGGHVLFTVALGGVVAWLGFAVDRWTEDVFPWLAGGVLIAFGLWYLWRQWRGQRYGHRMPDDEHDHPGHDQPHPAPPRNEAPRNDRAVVLGLLAGLTFSPCEGFLPVFVAGIPYGWAGFVLLSALLAAATLAGMLLFTWLTLLGFAYLRLERLERYEYAVVGALLCMLGAVVWILET